MLERLEDRCLLAVDIQFEWVGDFFNTQAKRDALIEAADQIASRLTNRLAEIPLPPNGAHKWTAFYTNPATGVRQTIRDKHIPADTLIVYVGGRSLGEDTFAQTCDQFSGGPSCGLSFVADDWKDLVLNRGQAQRNTWGGSMTFNTDFDWHFGDENEIGVGAIDFPTVALHELGHLLGFSSKNMVATSLVKNNGFRGVCTMQVHGSPVTMDTGGTGLHWAEHIRSNGRAASMSVGIANIVVAEYHQRVFTNLDFAALTDIGWKVESSPCAPRPKSDLVGRSLETGNWWSASSTESSFQTGAWGRWSESVSWLDVTHGDFDGDGRSDVAGRVGSSGDWWIARSTGAAFQNEKWGAWNPNVVWENVLAGDFNGDRRSDLAGRVASTGEWWVALSDGEQFVIDKWGRWSPNATWQHVQVGDVNGDGQDDLIGRVAATGDWWIARSDGAGFNSAKWGRWSPNAEWLHVVVEDFDGDGRDDIAGRVATTGDWWIGRSDGTAFQNAKWGRWSAQAEWLDVQSGDFNGDGRADLAGRVASNGDWWVAASNGERLHNTRWGRWAPDANWLDVQAGDFDRDGRSDLVGRVEASGDWWTARSTGAQFVNELWGSWSGLGALVDVKVGAFADGGASGRSLLTDAALLDRGTNETNDAEALRRVDFQRATRHIPPLVADEAATEKPRADVPSVLSRHVDWLMSNPAVDASEIRLRKTHSPTIKDLRTGREPDLSHRALDALFAEGLDFGDRSRFSSEHSERF